MILKPEIRSQFTIFLYFHDLELAGKLRTCLSLEGYEAFAFVDHETFLHRLRESTPHLVVFHLEAIGGTLSEYVEEVLKVNSEILFLPIISAEEAAAIDPYREYNFTEILPLGENLEVRLKWTVDQVCTQLYLQYQNEQLIAEKESQRTELESLKAKTKNMLDEPVFNTREAFGSYTSVGAKEDIVGFFLQRLSPWPDLKVLYLKYLPSAHNFVATQALHLDIGMLKGIGAKLTPAEVEDLRPTLLRREVPFSVRELMEKGFQVKEFESRGLFVHRGIDGIILFWGKVRPEVFENEFCVFSQTFFSFDLARRFDAVDFQDPISELFNRDFYYLKLEEEVARARRLQKPVAVVKVGFDRWDEICKQGPVIRDSMIRHLGQVIKKTSRVNDFACRTQDNEFSLILPHAARKGAAIRAERLRKTVEGLTFQYADRSLTVSCGISEYPTLCSSAQDLDQTAAQALQYIQGRGNNKVCLFRPNHTFKPDFEVPPI